MQLCNNCGCQIAQRVLCAKFPRALILLDFPSRWRGRVGVQSARLLMLFGAIALARAGLDHIGGSALMRG